MAEGPGPLGGLGALVQGFIQGRQASENIADQRQNRQLAADKNAEELLPIYQQLARTNPDWASSPGAAAAVNNTMKPLGVDMGSSLPSSFGQIDPASLLGNQAFMTWYEAQPKDMQSEISGKVAGGLPIGNPIDTAPTAQYHFDQMVSTNLNNLGKGQGMTPQAYINWVRTTAPRYGRDPNEYLSDPQTLAQLSQVSQQRVSEIAAKTGLTQKQAQMYGKLTDAHIQQMLSGADVNEARAKAIPEQTWAEVTRAKAAAQSAANGAANVSMKLNAIAQLGGTDPKVFTAVSSTMAELNKNVSALRIARDNLNSQWTKLAASMNASDPKVQQQIEALQQQAAVMTQQLNQSQGQMSQFEQGHLGMLQKAYQAQGAPMSWKATGVQTQYWRAGAQGGKPIKMMTYDGGLTFTDGKGNWFDANKNPVSNGPITDYSKPDPQASP